MLPFSARLMGLILGCLLWIYHSETGWGGLWVRRREMMGVDLLIVSLSCPSPFTVRWAYQFFQTCCSPFALFTMTHVNASDGQMYIHGLLR